MMLIIASLLLYSCDDGDSGDGSSEGTETPDGGEVPGGDEVPDGGEVPGGGEVPDGGEVPGGDTGESNGLRKFEHVILERVVVTYSENMQIPKFENLPDFAEISVVDSDKMFSGPGIYHLTVKMSAEGYEDMLLPLEVEVVYPEVELWNSVTPPTYYEDYTGEEYYVEFEIPEHVKEKIPDIKIAYIGNGQSKEGEHTIVAVAYVEIFGERIELDRFDIKLIITPFVTITFDPAGGECDVETLSVRRGTSLTGFEFPIPTRHGYTFTGWQTDLLSVNSDTTLTATWREDTYTLSYFTEDGVTCPSNPTFYGVSNGKITLLEPTRPGYKFLGWYDAAVGGNLVSEIDTSKTLGNKTLYDRWEIAEYTITYHSEFDLSTSALLPVTSYNMNSRAIQVHSIRPYSYGYDLDGWYTEPEFINKVEIINPKDYLSDIDLYAKYVVQRYTIFYDLAGGTNHPDNPEDYTRFDEDITLLAPTREGYEFLGWYGKHSSSPYTEKITVIDTDNSAYLIEARWKKIEYTFTITYELNGGYGFNFGEYPKSTYKPGEEFALLTPYNWHHDFLGWYTEPTFENKVESITASDWGDKTFYAKWEAHEFTIQYYPRGGTLPDEVITSYKYNNSATEIYLPIPERAGYEFCGWYGEEPDESVDRGLFYIRSHEAENFTLYAVWKPIIYSVDYDLCYKYPIVEPPFPYPPTTESYSADDPYTPPAIEYFFDNLYNFGGWYVDREYTTPAGTLGVDYFGDVTLYAKWIPLSYTITYNLEGGTNHPDNPTTICYDDTEWNINIYEPTRKGYKFVGWYWEEAEAFAGWNDEETGEFIFWVHSGFFTADTTLTAVWEIVEYTITLLDVPTFHAEDGSLTYHTETITYTVETPTFTIGEVRVNNFSFWYWDNLTWDEIGSKFVIKKGTVGDIVIKCVGEPYFTH